MQNQTSLRLDTTQLDRFTELGYLVLPDFLPSDLVARLESEVDRWIDTGLRARSIASCVDPESFGPPPVMELEMEAHGDLICYPPLMALLAQLMGPTFVFITSIATGVIPGPQERSGTTTTSRTRRWIASTP